MSRRRDANAWVQAHQRDPYVKKARTAGYRSRAAYKLLEIDARDRVLKPGVIAIDLGAAPGGWSQVAVERLAPQGRVFAVDKLPMEPLRGVEFIRGDFGDVEVLSRLREWLDGAVPDLILSDMAPNLGGMRAVDAVRSLELAEQVVEFSAQILGRGGSLVVKVFQGPGVDELKRGARNRFASLRVRKPSASRSRSAELYIVAKGFGI